LPLSLHRIIAFLDENPIPLEWICSIMFMLRTVSYMQPLTPLQVYSNCQHLAPSRVLVFDVEAIFNAFGLSLKLEGLNITTPWLMLKPKYVLM